ncbi:MAG: helix-turn-helix domain-containing protein [Puniceicoccales bacterium]
MLLEIQGAFPMEVQKGEYFWENRNRGPKQTVVFQVTEEGSCTFEWQGQAMEVEVGQAMIFAFGEESCYYRKDPRAVPYRNSWITFSGPTSLDLLAEVRKRAGSVLPFSRMPRSRELYRELLSDYRVGIFSNPWKQAEDLFRFGMGMLEELDSMMMPDDPVERCRERIQLHFRDSFTVSELAAQEGVSPEHLTREYRRRTGTTPARDLRQRRLEHALTLMQSHAISEGEAARFAGFRDVRSLQRLLGGGTPNA